MNDMISYADKPVAAVLVSSLLGMYQTLQREGFDLLGKTFMQIKFYARYHTQEIREVASI